MEQTSGLQGRKLMFKLKFLDTTKWISYFMEDNAEPEQIFLEIMELGKQKFPLLSTYSTSDVELVCDGGVLDSEVLGYFLKEQKSCTIDLVPKVPIVLEVNPADPYSPSDTSAKATENSEVSDQTEPNVWEVSSPSSSISSDKAPISDQSLLQKLKAHFMAKPGGTELLSQFQSADTPLPETTRKRVIHLIVDHLVEAKGCYPSTEEKVNYAKNTVILFPQLKDSFSQEGHEMLYDPRSYTGYFEWRLKTIRRSCLSENQKKIKTSKRKLLLVQEDVSLDISEEKRQKLEEEVSWLFNADPQIQTEDIKDKMTITFPLREELRKDPTKSLTMCSIYPRILDTPGLVSLEFALMKPEAADQFVEKFPKTQNKIQEVYNLFKDTEKHGSNTEKEENPEGWNKTTQSMLYLLNLLPPTARGKKKGRCKVAEAADRLILWNKTGNSLEEAVEKASATQPYLLACGPRKSAISDYFIVVDKKFVPCGKVTAIEAFDQLFKSHYMFNCEFDPSLSALYTFIGHFFYGICQADTLTPRMREVRKLLSTQDRC